MAHRVGYIRVSSVGQDAERQRLAVEAANCDRVFEEQASGKSLDRPVLNECLAYLRDGDTLVIHELDRLGRSMVQMLACVEQLLDRGVHVVTLDGKLNTEAMDPSIVKLIVGVLGYAAEQERKAILKRTQEGREIAVRNGVKLGRKRTYTEAQAAHVKVLRDQDQGYGTIANATGLSVSMVRRILAGTARQIP